MNRKVVDIFIIILILILIITIGYMIYLSMTDGIQCIANPILYYEQLKNISCNCYETNNIINIWG